MRFNIRFKLIGYTFLIVLIVGLTISWFSIDQSRKQILNTYDKECRQTTNLIAESILNDVYFLDLNSLRLRLQDTKINPDILHIRVADNQGDLLLEWGHAPGSEGSRISDEFGRRMLQASAWVTHVEGQQLKVGGPLKFPDGSIVGYLEIDYTLKRANEIIDYSTQLSALLSLICLVGGALLALIISTRITKPFQKIVDATEQISRGNFKTRVKVDRKDELGLLASSLNKMVEELEKSTTSISRLNEEISERKKAEAALRESEQSHRNLIETLPDLIATTDAQGRFTSLNPAFEAITGWRSSEWLGKHFVPIIHPDDAERIQGLFNEIIQGKNLPMFEVRVLASDGLYRVLETMAICLRRDGKVYGASTISRDITRRKEAESELQKLYSELESRVRMRTAELAKSNELLKQEIAERERTEQTLKKTTQELKRSNGELEQFAYVASHDLQEPIYVIQGFVDTIYEQYDSILNEDIRFLLQRIQNAAQRMSSLVEGLLEFSRVGTRAKPFEAVDLNTVVHEILTDLELRIRENGAKVEVQPLPVVQADRLQMRQLLQNLIGNALKFRKKDQAPLIQIDCSKADGLFELHVRDNGIGFDKEYAEKIFVPFQRLHTRSEYQGSGIGLAICEKIVSRHGGKIFAESEPGQGATFSIQLPDPR